MAANKQRNVMCDDETWDRIKILAKRHRRSMAGEVRVALEVYALLAERHDGAIEEILDGARR